MYIQWNKLAILFYLVSSSITHSTTNIIHFWLLKSQKKTIGIKTFQLYL